MQPDPADASYLLDMLRHAQGVVDAVCAITFERYAADENLKLAVERRIEIIGEAARRVSEPFKDAHPEVPWRKIVAQRNVLAHDYGDVDDELVYALITVHVPGLVNLLRGLLPPVEAGP